MIHISDDDAQKIQLITEIDNEINPRLLEKDFLVTKAISIVNENKNAVEGLSLVFGGGTCLSKAHGVINRMSEDMDFKIISDPELTRSQLRRRHSQFKHILRDRFEENGFDKIESYGHHENTFLVYEMEYGSIFPTRMQALRPFIKVECINRPLLLPPITRELTSMADRFLGIRDNVFLMGCQRIEETFVEKVMGLLRKLSDDRKEHNNDPALMRHVHDVSRLVEAGVKITPKIVEIFWDNVETAVRLYGAHTPNFEKNPRRTLLSTLERLKIDPEFRENYDSVIFPVLVDRENADYDHCIAVYAEMAEKLLLSENPKEKKKLSAKMRMS